MRVLRIVTNIAAADPARGRAFFGEVLGLEVGMGVASEGGSDAAVHDISIEVDRLDQAQARMREAGIPFEYGPVVEPWGVERFFVRDPFGRPVNVLAHTR